VIGANPSVNQQSRSKGIKKSQIDTRTFPVESLRWHDAQLFCKQLSAKTNLKVALPTDAEWEYACRAGKTGRYYTGEQLTEQDTNIYETVYGAYKVGTYPPNPWGLYDMVGNVDHMCADSMRAYTAQAMVDPVGPDNGKTHVIKGGRSWNRMVKGRYRSAAREESAHFECSNVVGFRVVARAPDMAVDRKGIPDSKPPLVEKKEISPPNSKKSLLTLQRQLEKKHGLVVLPASRNPDFSPDGKYVYMAGDNQISVVEASTGKCQNMFTISDKHVHSACFGPGNVLCVGTETQLQAWDWKENRVLRQTNNKEIGGDVLRIAPTKAPGLLTLGILQTHLVTWDAVNWKLAGRRQVPLAAEPQPMIVGFCPSADESRYLLLCARFWIWEPARNVVRPLEKRPNIHLSFLDWHISPNGLWVVAMSKGFDAKGKEAPQQLLIWDALNGKLLANLSDFAEQTHLDGFLSTGNHCLLGAARVSKRMILDVAKQKIIHTELGATSGLGTTFPSEDLVVLHDVNTDKVGLWKVNLDVAQSSDP